MLVDTSPSLVDPPATKSSRSSRARATEVLRQTPPQYADHNWPTLPRILCRPPPNSKSPVRDIGRGRQEFRRTNSKSGVSSPTPDLGASTLGLAELPRSRIGATPAVGEFRHQCVDRQT